MIESNTTIHNQYNILFVLQMNHTTTIFLLHDACTGHLKHPSLKLRNAKNSQHPTNKSNLTSKTPESFQLAPFLSCSKQPLRIFRCRPLLLPLIKAWQPVAHRLPSPSSSPPPLSHGFRFEQSTT
jgi:hypothetical protein